MSKVTVFFFIFFSPMTHSLTFHYAGESVFGQNSFYFPFLGQSLAQIAREYEIGPEEIAKANSHIKDPWFLYPWQGVSIPKKIRLPQEIHQNKRIIIVIIDELRMYARFDDIVLSYPVGVGKDQTPSPTGDYKITRKIKDPTWYPPPSIVKQQALKGVTLDKKVPPGPDNPLGTRGILFDKPSYLIHGTNLPGGVGRKSSAGCFRLNNTDVEELFEYVDVDDRLLIKKHR